MPQPPHNKTLLIDLLMAPAIAAALLLLLASEASASDQPEVLMIIGVPISELPNCDGDLLEWRYKFTGDLVDMDNVIPNEIVECSLEEKDS